MFHGQYEYRDPDEITVERVQYRRYLHEQKVEAIVSGFCWAATVLVLMLALATRVS